MKDYSEITKGSWISFMWISGRIYGKVTSAKNNVILTSECYWVKYSQYRAHADGYTFTDMKDLKVLHFSDPDIQAFLPEGHVEKIIPSSMDKNKSCIIDRGLLVPGNWLDIIHNGHRAFVKVDQVDLKDNFFRASIYIEKDLRKDPKDTVSKNCRSWWVSINNVSSALTISPDSQIIQELLPHDHVDYIHKKTVVCDALSALDALSAPIKRYENGVNNIALGIEHWGMSSSAAACTGTGTDTGVLIQHPEGFIIGNTGSTQTQVANTGGSPTMLREYPVTSDVCFSKSNKNAEQIKEVFEIENITLYKKEAQKIIVVEPINNITI